MYCSCWKWHGRAYFGFILASQIWPRSVKEPSKVHILVKFAVSRPQRPHDVPIKTKFGREEHTGWCSLARKIPPPGRWMVVDMRTSKNQSFGHVAVLSLTLRFIVNICAVNVDSEPDSDLKSVDSDCAASTSSLSFFLAITPDYLKSESFSPAWLIWDRIDSLRSQAIRNDRCKIEDQALLAAVSSSLSITACSTSTYTVSQKTSTFGLL